MKHFMQFPNCNLLVSIVITLILSWSGCKAAGQSGAVEIRKENGNSFMYVDLDLARDTIDFDISAIFDSCRIVKLENRTEALIGRVSGVAATEDRLYIYNQMKDLMIFDFQGKYQGKVGGLGKGPFEYTHVNDFVVNKKTGTILVMPANNDKYYIYSEEGEGVSTIPHDMKGIKILSFINDKVYEIGYGDYGHKLPKQEDIAYNVQNASGETIFHESSVYKAWEVRLGGISLPVNGYFYKNDFKVFFSRDTLFKMDLESGKMETEAVFTASKNGFDYTKVERDLRTGANTLANKLNRVYTEIHAETDRYYLLRQVRYVDFKQKYQHAKPVSYFCVDKKKKTVHPVRLKDTFWGLQLNDGSPMPFTKWEIIDNRYALMTYDAIDLLAEIDQRLEDQDLDKKIITRLSTLKNGLSVEDNVVVFVYYIGS